MDEKKKDQNSFDRPHRKAVIMILILTVPVLSFAIFQTVHANPCQVHAYQANLDYIRFLEDKLGKDFVQEKLAEDKIDPPPKEIEDWVFWECISLRPLSDVSIKLRMTEQEITNDVQG